MTTLDEARADDETFPRARFAAVFITLAHDHAAMLRNLVIRVDVADARQLPRDSE